MADDGLGPAQHIAHLREQGRLLAEAVRRGDAAMPVQGCPGWTLSDLVVHVGVVHQWAVQAVLGAGERPPRGSKERLTGLAPPALPELAEWYAAANAELADTLDRTSADAPMWQLWPEPHGVAFWARRQAHETAVHRLDAELAVGTRTPMPADLARDGIDELLTMVTLAGVRLDTGGRSRFGMRCTDTDTAWTLTDGPERRLERQAHPSDALAAGRAEDVWSFLWNRAGGTRPELTGDVTLWDVWAEQVRIG